MVEELEESECGDDPRLVAKMNVYCQQGMKMCHSGIELPMDKTYILIERKND